MALVECPECGGKVSDAAIACPHCGFPMQQQKKTINRDGGILAITDYNDPVVIAYLFIRHGFPFQYVVDYKKSMLPLVIYVGYDQTIISRYKTDITLLGGKVEIFDENELPSDKVVEYRELKITHQEYGINGNRNGMPMRYRVSGEEEDHSSLEYAHKRKEQIDSILGKSSLNEASDYEKHFSNKTNSSVLGDAFLQSLREERERVSRGIRCPNCGSRDCSKIGMANRAVGVMALGLASSSIGKSYKCYKCGYKW